MKKICIPETDICASRFIFGTASLFSAGASASRRRLLEAAVANGFTHFDTAPFYGFGMAERDLRPVLARHPEVTVTTKVGIYSPGGEAQSAPVIFLRKAGGRLIPSLSRPSIDWDVVRAQKSLEGSLRRLGRDRIDLYMLHGPILALLDVEEWQRWLERCVSSGQVRRFGLALRPDLLRPFLEIRSSLTDVVQTLDSLDRREADVLKRFGKRFQITYGYVSAARARGNRVSVPDILRQALRRNREGAIIVSTKRTKRLPQYARLIEDAT